jgi:hypothetical protein
LRTFSFYIHDQRYSVPTLQIVTVRDEERARELAQQRLAEGEHHLAIEVVEDQVELFRLERQGARRPSCQLKNPSALSPLKGSLPANPAQGPFHLEAPSRARREECPSTSKAISA